MTEVLAFDSAHVIRSRFARALPVEGTASPLPVDAPTGPPAVPRSNAEGLYSLYRHERAQQGWAEFGWDGLSEPQRLVWERMAAYLTGQTPA